MYEYFFNSLSKKRLLGAPIWKLVLYFPEGMLWYFKSLNWSRVRIGLGKSSKKSADRFAAKKGKKYGAETLGKLSHKLGRKGANGLISPIRPLLTTGFGVIKKR